MRASRIQAWSIDVVLGLASPPVGSAFRFPAQKQKRELVTGSDGQARVFHRPIAVRVPPMALGLSRRAWAAAAAPAVWADCE